MYWFSVRILNDYLYKNKISAKSNQNKEQPNKKEKLDLNTRMDKLETKMDEIGLKGNKMLQKLEAFEDLLRRKNVTSTYH